MAAGSGAAMIARSDAIGPPEVAHSDEAAYSPA